jgi:hypothetical protein
MYASPERGVGGRRHVDRGKGRCGMKSYQLMLVAAEGMREGSARLRRVVLPQPVCGLHPHAIVAVVSRKELDQHVQNRGPLVGIKGRGDVGEHVVVALAAGRVDERRDGRLLTDSPEIGRRASASLEIRVVEQRRNLHGDAAADAPDRSSATSRSSGSGARRSERNTDMIRGCRLAKVSWSRIVTSRA